MSHQGRGGRGALPGPVHLACDAGTKVARPAEPLQAAGGAPTLDVDTAVIDREIDVGCADVNKRYDDIISFFLMEEEYINETATKVYSSTIHDEVEDRDQSRTITMPPQLRYLGFKPQPLYEDIPWSAYAQWMRVPAL